ncbi:hypothetical protein FOPG_19240 [Fusarium oxysporum f. sp. conglutinans race 2 54008]|uniref:Uncharacterized protein n=1 Tax=Fusarium oxysporum f. sp. conglutinans race 2 54008 TaxID=1089457 RepID=X0GXB9_FUSOX|nr:hypothetical protein FOPG_19240 [Fusarium oxysporum f. sp. conglutinans race 2 54008]
MAIRTTTSIPGDGLSRRSSFPRGTSSLPMTISSGSATQGQYVCVVNQRVRIITGYGGKRTRQSLIKDTGRV